MWRARATTNPTRKPSRLVSTSASRPIHKRSNTCSSRYHFMPAFMAYTTMAGTSAMHSNRKPDRNTAISLTERIVAGGMGMAIKNSLSFAL